MGSFGALPTPCIYCGVAIQNPEAGEGDHVLPAAMGRFRNDLRFRKICSGCVRLTAACDEHFVRCGPEAAIRHLESIAPARNERGSTPSGSMGSPPARFLAIEYGQPYYTKPVRGRPGLFEPADQIILLRRNGSQTLIELHPQMSVDAIRRKCGDLSTVVSSVINVQERIESFVMAALEEIFGPCLQKNVVSIPAGQRRVKGRTVCAVNIQYYSRAIAKMAFHYFLLTTCRGFVGSESAFAPVRDFILSGGDYKRFCESVVELDAYANEIPAFRESLSHEFKLFENGVSIAVVLRFFMGPMYQASTSYRVMIARNINAIVVPGNPRVPSSAHVYRYPPLDQRAELVAGLVEKIV